MKVQCVIYFGQILTRELAGEYLQEGLDTHSVKTFQSSLTGRMTLNSWQELINLS